MNAVDVNVWGVAASLLLVGAAIALSVWERLGLERSIVRAAVRAIVQLGLIGAGLGLVLSPDAPMALSWAWTVAMVVIGAATVARRASVVPGTFGRALLSLGAAQAVSLGVIFGFGVFPLEARTLVPTAGMLLGNCIGATVLAARRTYDEIREHVDQVEVRLSLGMTGRSAVRPHLATAMTTAITPQIEQTKIVGLIALPGTMTGLLLAGTSARDAVLAQLVVMFAILGSVAVTSVLVGSGVSRTLITRDQRVVVADLAGPTTPPG
jgi:putative ABC transport system permease protein